MRCPHVRRPAVPRVLRLLLLAIVLAVTAWGIHAVVPALGGHVAMGVAALLLIVALVLARSAGVDPLE